MRLFVTLSPDASGYCRPHMRNTGVFSCLRVWFTLPSCRGFVVLSKVFVFAIIVSSVLITGTVAAVGTYPRLVLRDSQPITDRRPISNRGTSETA